MSEFQDKDQIDVIDLLKETMTTLLYNASPKVYIHRFDQEIFVKIALAFYINGGVSIVKEFLYCGDEEAEADSASSRRSLLSLT